MTTPEMILDVVREYQTSEVSTKVLCKSPSCGAYALEGAFVPEAEEFWLRCPKCPHAVKLTPDMLLSMRMTLFMAEKTRNIMKEQQERLNDIN